MLEWIINAINSMGYFGIALLMFLENIFPPIPSEVIMPLAGFATVQGKLNFAGAIAAGTVGSVVGALPWYFAGKHWGEDHLKHLADKYGKWLTLSGKDIDKAKNWFDKHGGFAVFFGRLVPGVRTFISVPAGIAKMNLLPFLLFSTIGTGLWVGLLTGAGSILGHNYQLVEKVLGPVSGIAIIALLVFFGIWAGKRHENQNSKKVEG